MEKHVESDHVGKDGELGTIHEKYWLFFVNYLQQ